MTNILVIDDDSQIITLMETVLSSETCCVKSARNGRDGLQMLREFPFDIVITDIIMPESDGFEVIMEINQMKPHPKVIAMTGGTASLSQEYLSDVAKSLRVHRVLYKPFRIEELMECIGIVPGADQSM